MRDLDKMIEDALGDEESEVLRRIGGDAGFVERAMGMFGAGMEWTVRGSTWVVDFERDCKKQGDKWICTVTIEVQP